jgi:plastocyanin
MRSIGRLGAIAAALVLALAFVACGGDDNSGGSTGSTGAAASTGSTASTGSSGPSGASGATTVTIHDFNYDPAELDVAPGTITLTVTNNDTTTHTFTTDDNKTNEEIGAGATVQVTVDVTEDLGWHCEIHPAMRGKFVVS